MAFVVILFGLVGARAFYVVETWGKPEMRTFWDILAIWNGGIVLYGSILGGVLGPVLGVPRDSCTPRGGRTGIVMEAIQVLAAGRH